MGSAFFMNSLRPASLHLEGDVKLPDVVEGLITITLGLLFLLCEWGLHLPEAARSFWGEYTTLL